MKQYRDITPFLIPDEHSYIKKMILQRPMILHKDVEIVFSYLSQRYTDIQLVENETYFSLFVPTVSEGVRLEYMWITTIEQGKKYLSVYPRLFIEAADGREQLFESDAFLRPSTLIVNAPVDERLEGLAYLMDYLIKEAANVEVSMLTLADGAYDFKNKSILPFVQNAVARKMLHAAMESQPYESADSPEELARDITRLCDIPMIHALEAVLMLEDFRQDIVQSERIFLPRYASSLTTMMQLYIEPKDFNQFLDAGFETIAAYITDNASKLGLLSCDGIKEQLHDFEIVDPAAVLKLNVPGETL